MSIQNQALIQNTSLIQEIDYDPVFVQKMQDIFLNQSWEQGVEHLLTYAAQLNIQHHHLIFRSLILVLESVKAWAALAEMASYYIQYDSQDPIIIYLLAKSLAYQNQTEEAAIIVQRAIELSSTQADLNVYLQEVHDSYLQKLDHEQVTINLRAEPIITTEDLSHTALEDKIFEPSSEGEQDTQISYENKALLPSYNSTKSEDHTSKKQTFSVITNEHLSTHEQGEEYSLLFLESVDSTNIIPQSSSIEMEYTAANESQAVLDLDHNKQVEIVFDQTVDTMHGDHPIHDSLQPHSIQPHSIQPHSIQPHSIQPHSIQPHSIQPHSIQPAISQDLHTSHTDLLEHPLSLDKPGHSYSEDSLLALDQALHQLEMTPKELEDSLQELNDSPLNLDTLLDIDTSFLHKVINTDQSPAQPPIAHTSNLYDDLQTDDQFEILKNHLVTPTILDFDQSLNIMNKGLLSSNVLDIAYQDSSKDMKSDSSDTLESVVMRKLSHTGDHLAQAINVVIPSLSVTQDSQTINTTNDTPLNTLSQDTQTSNLLNQVNHSHVDSDYHGRDSKTEHNIKNSQLEEAFALLDLSDISNEYPITHNKNEDHQNNLSALKSQYLDHQPVSSQPSDSPTTLPKHQNHDDDASYNQSILEPSTSSDLSSEMSLDHLLDHQSDSLLSSDHSLFNDDSLLNSSDPLLQSSSPEDPIQHVTGFNRITNQHHANSLSSANKHGIIPMNSMSNPVNSISGVHANRTSTPPAQSVPPLPPVDPLSPSLPPLSPSLPPLSPSLSRPPIPSTPPHIASKPPVPPPPAPSMPPHAPSMPPPAPSMPPHAPSMPPPAPSVTPSPALSMAPPAPLIATSRPQRPTIETPSFKENEIPQQNQYMSAIRFRQAEGSQKYIANVGKLGPPSNSPNEIPNHTSQNPLDNSQANANKMGRNIIVFLLISLMFTLCVFFYLRVRHNLLFQQAEVAYLDPTNYKKLSDTIKHDLEHPFAKLLKVTYGAELFETIKQSHVQQLSLLAWIDTIRWTIWGEKEQKNSALQALQAVQSLSQNPPPIYHAALALATWYNQPSPQSFYIIQNLKEPSWYKFFAQGWMLYQNNNYDKALQAFLKSDTLNPYAQFNAQILLKLTTQVYGIELANLKLSEFEKRTHFVDKERLRFILNYQSSQIPRSAVQLKQWLTAFVRKVKFYTPIEKQWFILELLPHLQSLEYKLLAQTMMNELVFANHHQSSLLYVQLKYASLDLDHQKISNIDIVSQNMKTDHLIAHHEYTLIQSELALQKGYVKRSLKLIEEYVQARPETVVSLPVKIESKIIMGERFIIKLTPQLQAIKALILLALKQWGSLEKLIETSLNDTQIKPLFKSLKAVVNHKLSSNIKKSSQEWKLLLQQSIPWLSHPLSHPLPLYINHLFQKEEYQHGKLLIQHYLTKHTIHTYAKLHAHLQLCLSWPDSSYHDLHIKACHQVLAIQPNHALALQAIAHLYEDTQINTFKALELINKVPIDELSLASERLLIRLSLLFNQSIDLQKYSEKAKRYHEVLLAQQELRTHTAYQELKRLQLDSTPYENYLLTTLQRDHQSPQKSMKLLKSLAFKGGLSAWQDLIRYFFQESDLTKMSQLLKVLDQEYSNDFNFSQSLDLMKTLLCFRKNNHLDLHQYKKSAHTQKFNARPPPSECRNLFYQVTKRFVSVEPNTSTIMLLAHLYLSVGEVDRTLSLYQNLLKRQPYLWEVRYALGLLYMRRKQNTQAYQVLKPFINTSQPLYASKSVRALLRSIQ